MWKRIEAWEGVEVVRVDLPDVIPGKEGMGGDEGEGEGERDGREVPEGERSAVGRLVALWELGGIFLENDLVALKFSDDVLRGVNATSTVVAMRLNPEGVTNWMIMSQAGSPFLRRWLERYEGEVDPETGERIWNDEKWKEMEFEVPSELAVEPDLDVTVLNGHSWYYPLASEMEGGAPLKKLWFGKTWEGIDESYGTHIWHWDSSLRELVTPETVRTIDTPLFCRIRRLFDNLDGDGYRAVSREKNANCSIVAAQALRSRHYRLFADYRVLGDDSDAKWVDSSGFHHHGWAPKGTVLQGDTNNEKYRQFDEHSFAVLPVPSGWDTRAWTVRMDLQLDATELNGRKLMGLFKIRTAGDGDIVVRIGHQQEPGYMVEVEWRELSQAEASQDETAAAPHQTKAQIPSSHLKEVGRSWHTLAITCDRREKGTLDVYLDGTWLGAKEMQLQGEPNVGQEIWINAREWKELDMGFRGSLGRFTVYADALTPRTVKQAIPNNAASLVTLPTLNQHVQHGRPLGSQDVLFVLLMMCTMLIALSLARSKRGIVREGLSYVRGALHGVSR